MPAIGTPAGRLPILIVSPNDPDEHFTSGKILDGTRNLLSNDESHVSDPILNNIVLEAFVKSVA
jgi:hypothetical protein